MCIWIIFVFYDARLCMCVCVPLIFTYMCTFNHYIIIIIKIKLV